LYVVVPGPDEVSRSFAKSLADSIKGSLCEPAYKQFPDGEQYMRLTCDVKGADVIYVKTMLPSQDSSLVLSALAADSARSSGAERVTLVAPYMAYARQDRQFLPGEPVSIRSVLRALWAAGFSHMATVEMHKPDSLRQFPGASVNVRPYVFMAEVLGIRGSNYVVLSPDLGALERAKMLAEHLKVPYDYIEKERDRITGQVTMKVKQLDVSGRDVIIVDDIISTGGTVSKAAEILRDQGARSVTVIVAHAVLAPGAEERLRSAGINNVFAANTTPAQGSFVRQVDVAPLVARELAGIMGVSNNEQ
jgi:ribose-phosphate pyrophosphokinase